MPGRPSSSPATPARAGLARRLVDDRRGANLAEYVLLVGLVAILALVAYRFFGRSVRAKADNQSVTIGTIQGTATP